MIWYPKNIFVLFIVLGVSLFKIGFIIHSQESNYTGQGLEPIVGTQCMRQEYILDVTPVDQRAPRTHMFTHSFIPWGNLESLIHQRDHYQCQTLNRKQSVFMINWEIWSCERITLLTEQGRQKY